MSDEAATKLASILASRAEYLIATAARAPSVQNTQPWRFKVTGSAVELYCDSRRKPQHRHHDLGLEPVVCMAVATAWLW